MDPLSPRHHPFAIPHLGCLWVAATGWLAAQEPAGSSPAANTTVIEGRVVDMRGEGVPAAKVWVVPWLEPDAVLAHTVADGEGFFRLGQVEKSVALEVRGTADGFCTGITRPQRDDVPVTLELQSAATVRGALLDKAGKGVSGATVHAQLIVRRVLEVHCEARTDARGHFEITDVPMGPVRFAAWVEGEGVAEAMAHVSGDAEIALQPGDSATTSLSVTIEGLPDVAHAKVRLFLFAAVRSSLPPPLDRPTLTAATWRMEHVPDRDFTASPIANGFTFEPREVRIKKGSGPQALRFTAKPRATATTACPAVVSGPDGKPLAGVALTMRTPNDRGGIRCLSDVDGRLALQTSLSPGSKAVVCSVDDAWVVDPPPGGKGAPRGSSPQIDVTVDPSTTIALRVAPAASVQGRLLGSDGRPGAMLRVELQDFQAARSPNWYHVMATTSDREGRFHFRGLPAREDPLRVNVFSDRGTWTSESLDVSKAGTNLVLAEGRLGIPAVVEGVVRGADALPVAGLIVRLAAWDEGAQLPHGIPADVITDRSGRYRFLAAPPGRVGLQWVMPGEEEPRANAAEFLKVAAGATCKHDLQLPAK